MKIENSVVLITGANRGIGLAFARELLARGARKIYAAARDPATVTLPLYFCAIGITHGKLRKRYSTTKRTTGAVNAGEATQRHPVAESRSARLHGSGRVVGKTTSTNVDTISVKQKCPTHTTWADRVK